MNFLRFKNTPFPTLLVFTLLFSESLLAQLPTSTCSPSGGTRADIIDVQSAYRAPSAAAPIFTIPAGATGALLTISSHANILTSPSGADEILGNEDFINITATLDLVVNTSSGMLNYAQNTNTSGSGTNLYSWLKTAFGTNVSTTIEKGQVTSPRLNGLTITRSGNQLTITEANNAIHSSYLLEFTSSTSNSFVENSVARLVFSGGTPNLKTVNVPANTNFIVVSRKGTVRISNFSSNGGTEEGYSDERLLLDLDNNKLNGYSTVANGANAAFRSTYVIQNHVVNDNVNRFTATGKVVGDFAGKSTTNSSAVPLSDVGISNSRVYFAGTPAAGGILTIDELPAYTNAFDGVYIIEFYRRTGLGMSVAFINTRTAFIAKGQGTFTGTSRNISIPAGSDFIFLRQAGNANNTDNEPNENSLQAYAVINLNANPPSASGFYYQQVGFGSSTQRRDDNFGFVNLPLNGTSARNATYSSGYYSTHANNRVYDLNFTLSADKSTLTIVNSYGLVATEYQTITEAQFFGRRPDLAFSTSTGFATANNGSCGNIDVTVSVCNPGSGNSPGAFPVAFYDKNPTTDATAKLIHLGNYANAVAQGNCNVYTFSINLASYADPNITIYSVINDNGSFATAGVGSSIGSVFTLAPNPPSTRNLAQQDPNSNYIECDYSNNLKEIVISGVMKCPTANTLTTNAQNPTLTGTWDNINSNPTGLQVTVNSVTYTLGTSSELTAIGNTWTLNLSAITLPIATYPVTVVTTNAKGTATDATTNELVIKDVGVVYLDLNGLTDNLINGTGIQTVASSQLYVNIINSTTGLVAAVVPVTANGKYSMPLLTARAYTFQLTTVQGVVGNAKPATTLPTDYVFTGEGVAASGDGTPNGESLITVVNESTLIPRFGIQKRPTSGAPDLIGTVVSNVVQGTRYNPGIFGGFQIPSAAFGGTDDGQINNIFITSLPTEILSITHGTTTYYRLLADIPTTCPTASCIVFPPAGLSIATNTSGQPTTPISMATKSTFLDGNIVIPYKTVDNAGFQSTAATNLTIPMVALKFQGGNWSNGSGANNQPDLTDGTKTLFWVDDAGSLTISAIVKNLVIYSGVNATVDGVCLTVNEKVDNQGGKLIMKANNETSYGQYLGPALNNIECQMVMNENGWHNIALPVNITASAWETENNTLNDPNLINLTNDPTTHNLYTYSSFISGGKEIGFYRGTYFTHSYGTWGMLSTGALGGLGLNYYIDNYFTNTTRVLKATGTSIDQSITLNTSNAFGGWNLIPNPYPVGLSVTEMVNDGFFTADIDKAIWVYDPGDAYVQPNPGTRAGSYRLYDVLTGTSIINSGEIPTKEATIDIVAPFQSFWVRRTDAAIIRRIDVDGNIMPGATAPSVAISSTNDPDVAEATVQVSIKPSYRSACFSTKHYKTKADIIKLRVTDVEYPTIVDETLLTFGEEFSTGYDAGYDIFRNSDKEGAPFLVSEVEGFGLAINRLPIPESNTTVPLAFLADTNGKAYKINLQEVPATWRVYLQDLLTGEWQELSGEQQYTFVNNTDFSSLRFVLHFNKTGEVISSEQSIIAWSTVNGIQLTFDKMKSPFVDVVVSNLMGQKLFEGKHISSGESFLIPLLKQTPEIYVVSVYSQDSFYTIKLVH